MCKNEESIKKTVNDSLRQHTASHDKKLFCNKKAGKYVKPLFGIPWMILWVRQSHRKCICNHGGSLTVFVNDNHSLCVTDYWLSHMPHIDTGLLRNCDFLHLLFSKIRLRYSDFKKMMTRINVFVHTRFIILCYHTLAKDRGHISTYI